MIPVYEPFIGEEEAEAVAAAVRAGEISGSFGENLPAFEREFAAFVGTRHGVATTSGTTALHLAVQALDLAPGDEVLVSASTNIATALAAYHNGAVPVPVDSERITWNLDLDLVEDLITPRTKAIIPVHLFGHPVDMDRLLELADRHDLAVIEDCAESHGATVRGRQTGTFGAHGLLQLLREQDHHHRRGRHGDDGRRRPRRARAAASQPRVRTSRGSSTRSPATTSA